MNNKYAFFLDIDGTLWNRGEIPEINKKAIIKARKQGNYVFVNTGRSRGFIPESLFEQIDFDGVVSGIGNSVTFGKDYIFHNSLTTDEVKYVMDFFGDTDRTVVMGGEKHVYYFAKGKDGKHGIEFKKRFETEEFFNTNKYYHLISSFDEYVSKYNADGISKITVWGQITDKEDKELAKRFFTINHPSENYFEIGTKSVNKATGMITAIEKIGVTLDHCVAIGDGENDIQMLESAGISVAMGNATKEVKEISTMVTKDCIEGGVAFAICEILNFDFEELKNENI